MTIKEIAETIANLMDKCEILGFLNLQGILRFMNTERAESWELC